MAKVSSVKDHAETVSSVVPWNGLKPSSWTLDGSSGWATIMADPTVKGIGTRSTMKGVGVGTADEQVAPSRIAEDLRLGHGPDRVFWRTGRSAGSCTTTGMSCAGSAPRTVELVAALLSVHHVDPRSAPGGRRHPDPEEAVVAAVPLDGVGTHSIRTMPGSSSHEPEIISTAEFDPIRIVAPDEIMPPSAAISVSALVPPIRTASRSAPGREDDFLGVVSNSWPGSSRTSRRECRPQCRT